MKSLCSKLNYTPFVRQYDIIYLSSLVISMT